MTPLHMCLHKKITGTTLINIKSQKLAKSFEFSPCCHPEFISGSLNRRFRNKFGMTMNKINCIINVMDEQRVVNFYKEYSPKILRFLKNRLPENEVEEILNDVFFEAIDNIATLRKKDNLQAWIYKIAHNKIVDFYRKKKIKSFLMSQVPYLDILAKEISQPEFILEKNQLRDKIEAAMRKISEKYQQILRLHYEEQMPIKKIALVLSLSPKATESLLYRARMQFIKAYERT